MKTKLIALGLIIASLGVATAEPEEKVKAPNGGRIISKVTPHAEFLLTPEKKVEVRFLEGGKVIAPTTQVVTVTMGDRAKPTKLAFTKDGDKLVSDKPVPEGDNLPVVLQIAPKEGEKPVSEKFNLNLSKCPECKLTEYACACDHAAEEKPHTHKEGEDHKH